MRKNIQSDCDFCEHGEELCKNFNFMLYLLLAYTTVLLGTTNCPVMCILPPGSRCVQRSRPTGGTRNRTSLGPAVRSKIKALSLRQYISSIKTPKYKQNNGTYTTLLFLVKKGELQLPSIPVSNHLPL